MRKRLIGLSVLLVLLFSLTACSQDLAAYKEDAKQEIESYAIAKDMDNYSDGDWAMINEIVADGKMDINKVINKTSVDIAVATAKDAIDGVKNEVDMYKPFHYLQKAYNDGWLKKEDIENIAYCRQNATNEAIPETIENDIKQAYLEFNPRDGMTVESVVINAYFGTYNDCVALMIGYIDSMYIASIHRERVADVEFIYGSSQRILIYKINK